MRGNNIFMNKRIRKKKAKQREARMWKLHKEYNERAKKQVYRRFLLFLEKKNIQLEPKKIEEYKTLAGL